jgi:hypothetical protein
VIDDPAAGKFLVKGSLSKANRKIRTDSKVDGDGKLVAEVDVYRTKYELSVAALRASGVIERFTSEPPEEAAVEQEGADDAND